MAKVKIEFNSDRTLGGNLSVVKSNGEQEGFGISALGKAAFDDAAAHGNPGANQLFLFGDTPTGSYNITEITDFGPPYDDTNKYGDQGVIKLDPLAGNAMAAKDNGRRGLLIHAGKLGSGGSLRRTNGCIRLRNDEMKYLKGIIADLSISDPVTTVEVIESGIPNIPCFDNATCGEGDPPPGF